MPDVVSHPAWVTHNILWQWPANLRDRGHERPGEIVRRGMPIMPTGPMWKEQ